MTKHILIIFILILLIYSCRVGGQNEAHNSNMVNSLGVHTKSAHENLKELFNSPNDYYLKDIYSQPDSLMTSEAIYFFYTIENSEQKYCSKFISRKYGTDVTNEYHKEKDFTSEELKTVTTDLDSTVYEVIESVETLSKNIDSTKSR